MTSNEFGRYPIERRVGRGRMGKLFQVEGTSLDQKAALQFLPNEMEGDSTARTRLVHEARSAAALDHSYICHINEVGASDGRAFIARGYLSDWSLKERLRAGLSPRNEGLQQAIAMAKVLETGHAKRIILRDIQ